MLREDAIVCETMQFVLNYAKKMQYYTILGALGHNLPPRGLCPLPYEWPRSLGQREGRRREGVGGRATVCHPRGGRRRGWGGAGLCGKEAGGGVWDPPRGRERGGEGRRRGVGGLENDMGGGKRG